jgi:3-hydroxy-9,10-secoandrosta-1,3,5(10)-triene-9,17-dione monooxygenase
MATVAKLRDDAPSLQELVAAAERLRPLVAKHAMAAEENCDVSPEVIEAFLKEGFHKIYMPRRFGGYEMDWGAHFWISRVIAQECGAAGWITSLVFSHILWVGRMPAQAQEAFFDQPGEPILATGSAGHGVLTPCDGGWRLTGRWAFLSGINHASAANVVAKTDPKKTFTHFVMLFPDQYEVQNTWDPEGLRGTGSNHIEVKDQFIPVSRVLSLEDMAVNEPPGSKLHDSYIYRVQPAPYQKSWFAGPLLGTAQGAMNSYLDQTRSRMGSLFGESIAKQTPVQVKIGESMAEIEAAEVMFERYIQTLHEAGRDGVVLAGNDLLRTKRTMSMAAKLCVSAGERLSGMMGITGQNRRNPVQRLFRDCRTISTHIELHWEHAMAPGGQYLLGLETGDPMADRENRLAEKDGIRMGSQI